MGYRYFIINIHAHILAEEICLLHLFFQTTQEKKLVEIIIEMTTEGLLISKI